MSIDECGIVGTWGGLVVICAATPWDGIKFQDRHLAERLSTFRPVLYVDPPMSRLGTRRRPELAHSLDSPRLRLVKPGLARLTVLAPPLPERPGVSAATASIFRRRLRHATTKLGGDVAAVIAASTIIPCFGACGERTKIYWAQDDQVSGAKMAGFSPRRVERGETKRVAAADVVVASNPEVAKTWRERGYDPVFIPFGCDSALFSRSDQAPWPADVFLEPPIAGFIGGLVPDRIDVRMLAAVAERGHSLLLVGPAHARQGLGEIKSLLDRPNVQWVGPRPFEDLPSYLRVMDVGLVPYADTAFNRGSFPLKTLEYLAAGKPVISSDLPALRWLDSALVSVNGDAASFVRAVEASFASARDPALMAERRSFARAHSWEDRARRFADLIDAATDRSGSDRAPVT